MFFLKTLITLVYGCTVTSTVVYKRTVWCMSALCGVRVHCVMYECTLWCMSALRGARVQCVVYECAALPLGLILCQKTLHSLVSPSPSSPPCRHRHDDMALRTTDTRHVTMDIRHKTWWYGTMNIRHKIWWHDTLNLQRWHYSMSKLTFWLLTQPLRHQHKTSHLIELVDRNDSVIP